MKFEKAKQLKTIGAAVSLALLVGMGTVNAGGKSNAKGASIGVSNACALDEETMTIFSVTTTVTDKSSGDTPPTAVPDGSFVTFKGKLRKGNKTQVLNEFTSEKFMFTMKVGDENYKQLNLCDVVVKMSPDTVSLNAEVSVAISNSTRGVYDTSRCSDDPLTEGVNEGKVLIHYGDLVEACKP
jgi:hypothetical protein